MKIFDNYLSKLREFKPIKENEVTLYVCGPTVYNYIHIGNARPVVFFDVVRRYLEFKGYQVNLISNLTDVDDKIINRAIEEEVSEKDISEKYTAAFIEAGDKLNVKRASHYPKATDYINEMATFIEGLIDKGFAYEVEGDVYFRVSKIEEYGKLSNQSISDLEVGARIEENSKKENPLDFTLWKATEVGVNYPTKWSEGRPGWHTECVVMIDALTGGKIDIHAGGSGLKFPHHENEIAQSKAMHDHNIANYWMHVGFININNQKMSKSEGEVKWVKDLIEAYSANVLRLSIISTHYRQPINFSDDLIKDCIKVNDKIVNAYKGALVYSEVNQLGKGQVDVQAFDEAMANDFNTANAITSLLDKVKVLNQVLRQKEDALIRDGIASVEAMAQVLGLELPVIKFTDEDRLVYKEWIEARKAKEFDLADSLRKTLDERGLI